MEFKIESSEPKNQTVTLKLIGEMDIYSAPQLKDKTTGLCQQGIKNIILDLSALKFVDSIGIGVIVASLMRTREKGGQLVVVNPTASVERLMNIVGLFQLLKKFNSVEEAQSSLS